MPSDSNSEFNEVIRVMVDLQKGQEDLKALAAIFDTNLISIRRNAATIANSMRKDFLEFFNPEAMAAKFVAAAKDAGAAWAREQKAAAKEAEDAQINALKNILSAEKEAQSIRKAMYKDEEQYHLEQVESVHSRIIQLHKQEAEASASQPGPAASLGEVFGSPNGLRAGAGVAGALGHYQVGAALYGASHVQQMAETAGGMDALAIAAAKFAGAMAPATLAISGFMMAFHSEDFDNEVARVGTLLGETSTKTGDFRAQLDHLAVSAKQLSVDFNMDITSVLEGFKEALSTGIKGDELEAFGKQAGILATALGTDFKDATHILTAFKTDYGATIGELGHINDVLFTIIRTGGVDVKELTDNFGRLLGIAREAGVSMEDMAAGVSVLSRSGFTTSQAITSLMTIIEKTVAPTGKAKKALEELGLAGQQAFGDNGFLGFIDKLKTATGGQLDIISTMFPDRFSKRGLEALIAANDTLHQVSASAHEVGTGVEAASEAMDTFGIKSEKVSKALTDEFLVAGRDLLKQFNDLLFGKGPMSKETIADIQIGIEYLANALKIMAIVVTEIGAAFVHNALAAKDFITLNWSDMFVQMDKLLNILPDMGNAILDASQDTRNRIDEIKAHLNDVATDSKAMERPLTTPWEAQKASIDAASGSLDTYTKKLQQVHDDEIKDHARPDQEHELKRLKDEITKTEAEIAAANVDITRRVADEIQGYRESTSNLGEHDPAFLAYGNGSKHDFLMDIGNRAQAVYEKDSPVGDLKERLEQFKAQMDEIEKQVMGQMTDDEFKKGVKWVEDLTRDIQQDSDRRAAIRKAETDKEKALAKEVVDAAIIEYKREEDAYKKFQDEKLKKEEDIQKKILDVNESVQDTLDKLMEHKNSLAIQGAAGDPARQRHIAQEQYADAQDKLSNYASTGGGDKRELGDLIAAVGKAADAIEAAEKTMYGESVASKHRSSVDDSLYAYGEQYRTTEDSILTDQYDSVAASSMNKPSYTSAAAIAAQRVGDKKNVEQKVINTVANIKLNIDGTVSPQTLKAIADATRAELEKSLNQGTDRSNYDPNSYGSDPYDPAKDPRVTGTVGNGAEGDIYGN